MPPFSRLAELFRGRPPIDPAELDTYRQVVGPLVRRLDELYLDWRDGLAQDIADQQRANEASILRWEAAGLYDRVRTLQPPGGLTRSHDELQKIAFDTARAAQLLSNGHRFNSSRTRCDGQALMLDCQERFTVLSQRLGEHGLRRTPEHGRTSGAPLAAGGAESDP